MVDWVLVAFVGFLLGLIFFMYLMLRRTVLSFREGMEGDRDRR
jgi:hypothetical protein